MVTGSGNAIGGIVGDNSSSGNAPNITRGTVEHSFSSAAVSRVGGGTDIGGVVGSNWGGIVRFCYATGTVNGGNFVGGVVGRNHRDGQTHNNVALNPSITSTGTSVGRVEGHGAANTGFILNNNFARSDMQVNGLQITANAGAATPEGTSITAAQWGSAAWWRTQGFDAVNWPESRLPLGGFAPASAPFDFGGFAPALPAQSIVLEAHRRLKRRYKIKLNADGTSVFKVKERRGEFYIGAQE
jgi:hypothetical protein